ncbi:MAG: HD domain-containing protein [Candidatus Mycalebacterium zealandia]|nr:MAG: HD domain-containing protein [Candidatus Mycalebacterium zealandia]
MPKNHAEIDTAYFSDPLFKKARGVVRSLKDAGHSAFMVGGCVRNMLCGLKAGDFDLTTSATPQEVRKIFPRTVAVGESFGVIIVLKGPDSFEVATFRKDFDYKDGRHPETVSYGTTEKEDVERRDFTINGLLLDPESGEIFDYVGGREDLEAKVVRTIGEPERRFAEDRLRMLRAARFTADMGFEVESRTFRAIVKNSRFIEDVSAERTRDEIVKILTRGNSGRGLGLLRKMGLLAHVLPEANAMAGVEQPPEFHPEGDVFVHTQLVLDKLEENTPDRSAELAVAALLHDVGKPPTFELSDRIRFNGHDRVGAAMSKKICRRLRFSNKQIERISELVRHHLKFKDIQKMRESTLKRFLGMPYFEEHLALHLADCLASHGMTDAYEFAKAKLKEMGEEEIKPKPILTGKDLIKMGFEPGPEFSKILAEIEEAQLENRLKTKKQAKEFVKEKWQNG